MAITWKRGFKANQVMQNAGSQQKGAHPKKLLLQKSKEVRDGEVAKARPLQMLLQGRGICAYTMFAVPTLTLRQQTHVQISS